MKKLILIISFPIFWLFPMVSLNADTGQLLPRYGVVYGSDINNVSSG